MKLALLQLNSGSDMPANIARVGEMVREAASAGATLIATPENCFLMNNPHPTPLPKREREASERAGEGVFTQQNHSGILAAQRWARELGVWVLLGSVAVIPRLSRDPDPDFRRDDEKKYNRSILINPQGNIAAAYDKIHLFDVDVPNDRSYRESDKMLAGDRAVVAQLAVSRLQLVEAESSTANRQLPTTLGLTICYDVRFPHLYRTLAKMGANIIAVPAAFTKVTGEAHWHVLLRARAIENGCFIIAPAQTGTHAGGRQTYGHSLVVDPWGRVIADGGEGEKIVYAEIDLSEVERVRARLPSLNHDQEFT